MKRPLSLDLGTKLGWAHQTPHGLFAGVERLRPLSQPKAMTKEQWDGARALWLKDFLVDRRGVSWYDGFVIELVAGRLPNRSAQAMLYGLRMMVLCLAANWKIGVLEVRAQDVYAHHDTRPGDKEVLIDRVKRLYGIECKTADEADAVALAKFWEYRDAKAQETRRFVRGTD